MNFFGTNVCVFLPWSEMNCDYLEPNACFALVRCTLAILAGTKWECVVLAWEDVGFLILAGV